MAFFSKPKYSKVNVKSREGVAKGVWTKCPESGDMVFAKELKKNLMVVPSSDYHFPLSAPERIASLLDSGTFEEHDQKMRSTDPLKFKGIASYSEKLEQTVEIHQDSGVKIKVHYISPITSRIYDTTVSASFSCVSITPIMPVMQKKPTEGHG